MPRLISISNRGLIPISEKIKAFAKVAHHELSSHKAVTEVYKELNLNPPKSPTMAFASWRKQIEAALENEDKEVIRLCQQEGIIAE